MIEQEGATAPLTELLHSRNEGVGRILSTFLCKPERPTSVANPGCLSRIMIFMHPGSRVQLQKRKGKIVANKKSNYPAIKKGGGKNLLSYLFCSLKFY
jgi:hypothetical protein